MTPSLSSSRRLGGLVRAARRLAARPAALAGLVLGAMVLSAVASACGGEDSAGSAGTGSGPVHLCDRGIYEGGAIKSTGDEAIDACLTSADGVSKRTTDAALTLLEACGALALALGGEDSWSSESDVSVAILSACGAAAEAVSRTRGQGSFDCDVGPCADGPTIEVTSVSGTNDNAGLKAAILANGPAIYATCACSAPLDPAATKACSDVTSGATKGGDDASSCLKAAGGLIVDSVALAGYVSAACQSIVDRLDC